MDNCCTTKYQFFKVKDVHFFGGITTELIKHFTQAEIYSPIFEQVLFSNYLPIVANYGNPPPLSNAIPIYLLGSVFLI